MSRRLIATAAAILACAIPVAASAALTKVGTPAVTIAAVLKGPGDTKVGDFKGTSSSLNVADDGTCSFDSRPVHMYTLSKDVDVVPPKARTY